MQAANITFPPHSVFAPDIIFTQSDLSNENTLDEELKIKTVTSKINVFLIYLGAFSFGSKIELHI